jgi:hypothetical protein
VIGNGAFTVNISMFLVVIAVGILIVSITGLIVMLVTRKLRRDAVAWIAALGGAAIAFGSQLNMSILGKLPGELNSSKIGGWRSLLAMPEANAATLLVAAGLCLYVTAFFSLHRRAGYRGPGSVDLIIILSTLAFIKSMTMKKGRSSHSRAYPPIGHSVWLLRPRTMCTSPERQDRGDAMAFPFPRLPFYTCLQVLLRDTRWAVQPS